MMWTREVNEYLEALIGDSFSESWTTRNEHDGDVLYLVMDSYKGESVTFRINEDAIRCDCGKGLYCPLVTTVEES
jgi:hypothetical protein